MNLTLWFHSGPQKARGERGHRCYPEVQPPCSRPSPWPSRSLAAAELPEFTSWGGRDPKPANQQDPEAWRPWETHPKGHGGSRGPAASTAETDRMKRGLHGRVGCPLRTEQWGKRYLGVSEARGAGRRGQACGPGPGLGGVGRWRAASPSRGAQAKPQLTLQSMAGGAEHQEGWSGGIRGVVRAWLTHPEAQGPATTQTLGSTLFPSTSRSVAAAVGVRKRTRFPAPQPLPPTTATAHPHPPAPHSHPHPSLKALRGITMGAVGVEERSFKKSAQATSPLPPTSPPLLVPTPGPWMDSLSPGRALDPDLRLGVTSVPHWVSFLSLSPLLGEESQEKTSKYYPPLLAYLSGY